MINLTSPEEWQNIVRMYGITPMTETGYFVSAIYLTIIGVIATVGNLMILITFLRDKGIRRKPQNMLLLNLAISDIGISIFGYPWTTASNYAGRYLFGEVFCSIQGFMTFTFAQTDMNTLACISIFRYFIICYPQHAHALNSEVAKLTIVFTWIYTLLWTTPPLFGWSSYIFEPFGTSCSIDWTNPEPKALAYTWSLIIFCFLIHVAIMVFCYHKIVLKFRKIDQSTPLATITNPRTGELIRAVNMRRERRVTAVAFLLNITFILLWLPYTVVCLWSVYDKSLPPWVLTFPTFFAKASCAMNPFLYFLSDSSMRKKIIATFKCGYGKVRPVAPRAPISQSERDKDGVCIGRDGRVESSIM